MALAAAALAAALVALATLGAGPAEAKKHKATGGKIVFVSERTTGKGVDNPEGDAEIFVMDPNGAKLKQITRNAVDDFDPTLSPDGKKIAYWSSGAQPSNPEGDTEVYLVSADGSGKKNLSNNGTDIGDFSPDFSPDGKKLAYESDGDQTSNPEGDSEVYLMNANGSGQKNLSNNGSGVEDFSPESGGQAKKK